ncbi:MAG: endolytic transglycosylase MltG [Cyanobacteria bacterium J083]|nr:MAG: endolytic transglycosylase MltG [Cyanobacteria bacterium J083]
MVKEIEKPPFRQPSVKKSQKKSWLYLLLLLLLGSGIGSWQAWLWWKGVTAPVQELRKIQPEKSNNLVTFKVEEGMTGNSIGKKLESVGLIRSATAWKIWTKWHQQLEAKGNFKSGTYLISPTEPMSKIAQKIWRGEVMQAEFTIPEGWNIQQMADYFASIGYFSAAEFIAATKEIPYTEYPWLPKNLKHLEGFLYPNTYKISSDRISPSEIIKVMLDEFARVALPLFQAENKQADLTLQDWVTLSSIVEKEAVVAKERTLIAGVFLNRLRIGMPLQTDPTVEYGLGIKQTADRPLTYKEVKTPSPYNTYINPGLPPTAIASPGLESLKAVLKPAPTKYLYFVARYDGTHIFSSSLSAHNRATVKIRRQRNSQLEKKKKG